MNLWDWSSALWRRRDVRTNSSSWVLQSDPSKYLAWKAGTGRVGVTSDPGYTKEWKQVRNGSLFSIQTSNGRCLIIGSSRAPRLGNCTAGFIFSQSIPGALPVGRIIPKPTAVEFKIKVLQYLHAKNNAGIVRNLTADELARARITLTELFPEQIRQLTMNYKI
jgi:hypothetical protein